MKGRDLSKIVFCGKFLVKEKLKKINNKNVNAGFLFKSSLVFDVFREDSKYSSDRTGFLSHGTFDRRVLFYCSDNVKFVIIIWSYLPSLSLIRVAHKRSANGMMVAPC